MLPVAVAALCNILWDFAKAVGKNAPLQQLIHPQLMSCYDAAVQKGANCVFLFNLYSSFPAIKVD